MTVPDILYFLEAGYWMAVPAALLLLVSVCVTVERYVSLRRLVKTEPSFTGRLRECILEGDLENALNICRSGNSPVTAMLAKGVEKIGRPVEEIKEAMTRKIQTAESTMHKGFPWLTATIAGAPLLGFTGTFAGLAKAFATISREGDAACLADLSLVSYPVFATAVAGLIAATFAAFAKVFLTAKANAASREMQSHADGLVDTLEQPC